MDTNTFNKVYNPKIIQLVVYKELNTYPTPCTIHTTTLHSELRYTISGEPYVLADFFNKDIHLNDIVCLIDTEHTRGKFINILREYITQSIL